MITQSNNGNEAVGIINQALIDAGSDVVIGNESGSSVAGKLNEVFGDDIITSSQSGSQFAQAVEDGFDGMEPAGEPVTMKFLHTSDTHGYVTSLNQIISLVNEEGSDVDFAALTGDWTKYGTNNTTTETKTAINSLKPKILMCPGNHDTYDNSHSGYGNAVADQVSETAWLKDCIGNNVVWGDSNNVGGYWHKDITKEGKTLRIISLDQYCVGSTVYTGSDRYNTVYSQAEIDWLLNLLYNTPSSYYVIIMMHEPPVQSPTGSGTDTAAVNMAGENLFVSDCLKTFGNRRNETDLNLLPRIMKAYLHQENLSFSYDNYADRGGHGTLAVAKDFRNHVPAHFLFYLGGHQHEDICGYIPYTDWADQLMIFVAAGDSSVRYSNQDDLLWNYDWRYETSERYAQDEPSYRVNEVVIDFATRSITVTRIGNKTTAPKDSTDGADRPNGSRVRTTITFPFKKS